MKTDLLNDSVCLILNKLMTNLLNFPNSVVGLSAAFKVLAVTERFGFGP